MSGILALQLHAGPPMKVEFKNIRLRRTKLAAVEGMKDRKKIVMVAGRPSHGPATMSSTPARCCLKKCLDENVPYVVTHVYRSGWPKRLRRRSTTPTRSCSTWTAAADIRSFRRGNAWLKSISL